MYSIGEFSRITGLTVKTLRFYHEQGLLVPTCVDDQSGYRYYAADKVETARVIRELRALEFPLDEIAEILRGCEDEEDILDFLQRRRDAVDAQLGHYRSLRTRLDRLLSHQREARRTMQTATHQIEEKILPEQLVAAVRMRGKYSDCGGGFARIGRRFGRHVCGPPLLLHYDSEYREDDADFEACMPIRRGTDADGVTVRTLPGGRGVCLLHQGPYQELGRSYARVLEYVKSKGREVVLPTREVYLKGPGMIFKGNPKKYLTEIQFLLRDG